MLKNLKKKSLPLYIITTIIFLVAPIGYFAPIGEWVLLSLMFLGVIFNSFVNPDRINFKNSIFLILTFTFMASSFFWSLNSDRTAEVILPTTGLLLAIYILICQSNTIKLNSIHLILGNSLLFTSVIIFLDLVLDIGIRTYFAELFGDKPTSPSGSFSRGLLIISMLLPITTASLLSNKKYFLSIMILALVFLIIFMGPNDTAKLSLILSSLAAIIIYYFGPKSFLGFGIIIIIWILFAPVLVQKVFPFLTHIEKTITITDPAENCTKRITNMPESSNYECNRLIPWQDSSLGGSLAHRLLVWEFVGKEINKNLFLGNGLGTSRLIGQNIILKVPGTKKNIHGAIPLHPHNSALEIWLELGLIGAIFFCSLWLLIVKLGFSLRKKSLILGTGACATITNIFIISSLSFGIFQAWWLSSIGLIFFLVIQTSNNYPKS